MEPFRKLTALAAVMPRQNVDTDQIIPKQFLKKIERTGFGRHAFHDWRYLDEEETRPNPDFELNQPRYQGAQILFALDNFGCGSSREHAPWALKEYGFRSIIAPSFADIFYNNSVNNGLLPVVLERAEVDSLIGEIESREGARVTVDLEEKKVISPGGREFGFSITPFARDRLLKGLDQIGWALQFEGRIDEYESGIESGKPWMLAHQEG